jgi:hypothetical protein
MIVNRVNFNEILKKCFPVVEQKSGLYNANFDCFLFKDGFVHAYNNYMSISVKLSDDFDIDYMLINAKELKGIFDRMKGNDIVLLYEDDTLIIKDGKMNVKLSGTVSDDNNYCIDGGVKELKNVLKGVEWKAIPDNFFQALNFSFISSSIVMESYKAGVNISGCDVYSAAGNCMSWFKLNSEMDAFFITENCIKNIMKIEGLKKYCVSEDWAHFSTDDGKIVFSSRLIDYKFPLVDCERVKNSHFKKGAFFNAFLPGNLEGILDRALLFIEKYNDIFKVDLCFSSNGLTVSAKKNRGEFEEFVEWEGKMGSFEDFFVSVNLDLLKFGLREKLTFSFLKNGGGKEATFTNLNDRLFAFTFLRQKGVIK